MSAACDASSGRTTPPVAIRHDWTRDEVLALLRLPFPELMFRAQMAHRVHFEPTEVQVSTLLSIKTGGCPEDCAYCPQSVHFDTGVKAEKLMRLDTVLAEARAATCVTLGMLTRSQAQRLKDSGLDYYNHNLDTSPEYYQRIITTRTYQDRLDTLAHVRDAGIHVCCGGIVGMGESIEDRAGMIATLASLPVHPESVPINLLVQVEGTPLATGATLDPLDFVRTIAATRIAMPASMVRLSAGREDMSDETQALCFLAGANSVFYGPKLLTTPNPEHDRDARLFERLGLAAMR
jgi:biotin synthase